MEKLPIVLKPEDSPPDQRAEEQPHPRRLAITPLEDRLAPNVAWGE